MDTHINLPSEFDAVLQRVAAEPAHTQAMWRYAVALSMIDTEQANLVEVHQDGDTLHLIVQTVAGDRFGVARPAMSEESEQTLLERVRTFLHDGSDGRTE